MRFTHKIRRGAVIFASTLVYSSLSLCGVGIIKAQDMQSNPFSRLGFGTLQDPTPIAWRSMGGVGNGINDPLVINLKNPAAYAGTDSLSFLMDVGVSVQMGHFKDELDKRTTFLGGLDYIAMQFPLYKDLVGFSFGITPFSSSGYGLSSSTPIDESGRTILLQSFKGQGSLQKVYAGVGVKLWDRLYLGINGNYLFGSLTHTVNTVPNSTVLSQSMTSSTLRLGDWGVDLGMQYRFDIDAPTNDNFLIGLTYSPSLALHPKFTEVVTNNVNDPLRQTVTNRELLSDSRTPHKIGAGVSWSRPSKYRLAADFDYALWSTTPNIFANDGVAFRNRYQVGLGFEFIPDAFSRDYGKVMKYRFGLNYSSDYLKVTDLGDSNRVGASFGLGMPVNFFGGDKVSMINLGLDYSRSFWPSGVKISNDVLRLSLSVSFNETWFRELKIY